jgi:phospholipid/cholesterol/gamma-HCH transport system ATP-binding protein
MSDVILELKNIHKTFGANHIHRGISLSLKKGESLGLLGGSGAGKSALLRSIIGLERIDSGEIYFQNTRIDQLSENDLRRYRTKISYSFQSGALFDSINVFENIAYPLFEHTKLSFHQIETKVKEMLALIDLPGKEKVMPSDLSGGMQKRVGMARAIILHPEIILYDEPTAGLDPSNTLNVISLMEKLKRSGLASIFVTHDIPSAVMLCDRIVVLSHGTIIFSGTPLEFEQSDDPVVRSFITNKG